MPRHELLAGSAHPQELEAVIAAAEQGLRSWEPVWTDFMDGGLREEAEQRLAALAELDLASWGGFPGAERRRLLLQRRETALAANALPSGLLGLEISGNFLFDQAERADFRSGLLAAGASQGDLGDIWLRGDRGAQAIVTASLASALDGLGASVRSVEVRLEVRPPGAAAAASRAPAPSLPDGGGIPAAGCGGLSWLWPGSQPHGRKDPPGQGAAQLATDQQPQPAAAEGRSGSAGRPR